MAVSGTSTQQPSEVMDYDLDFDIALPPDDVIVAATVKVEPTGPTVTRAIKGREVRVWFSGGTDKVTYKVTVTATTNDGRVKESEIKIKVKED